MHCIAARVKHMDKQDLYKLFAILLVVIFLVEMIALGAFNSTNRTATPSGGSGQTLQLLNGTVDDNITIVRYEPYLIVTGGNETRLDMVTKALTASGLVTYAVPDQGSIIVNLNESRSAPVVAKEYEKANATVAATAVISTSPKITVVGGGVATTADGTSFRLQIRPIYDEGSVVPAQYSVTLAEGQLYEIYSFSILPRVLTGVPVNATVISLAQSDATVLVPWENRNEAKPIALAENATYKEKSYILVRTDAVQAQLDAIKAAYAYITGTQQGIVSVDNTYENITQAQHDMELMNLSPVFPPSTAIFANASGNASAVALSSKLEAAGIPSSVVTQVSLKVQLPQTIEYNGMNYTTNNEVLVFSGAGVPDNIREVPLAIDFETAGNKITRIITAQQAG
ncbi:Uncharacterised protein [uncultured archaeon]|nr:Uncharacterised protein [uncultured archaeon]